MSEKRAKLKSAEGGQGLSVGRAWSWDRAKGEKLRIQAWVNGGRQGSTVWTGPSPELAPQRKASHPTVTALSSQAEPLKQLCSISVNLCLPRLLPEMGTHMV